MANGHTIDAAESSTRAGEPAVKCVFDFNEVRRRERDKIRERRGKPEPLGTVVCDEAGFLVDLTGLALSGGGIRAASVGLGALQALYTSGHWPEFDYLSTVSGGGYIGGYVSAAAMSDKTHEALSISDAAPNSTGFGQPSLVQRFIYGGKYLLRPWEAANKYLIGLFFNNLLLFSGIVMAAAAIAGMWRSLDYEWVRDQLEFVRLNSGVTAAFLPFYAFLICWIIRWIFSRTDRRGEAPERSTQRLLYCVAGSFAIGVALLLVNTETTLGFSSDIVGESKIVGTGTIGKWLLGLLTASLTPLLAPAKLLQFGMRPKNVLQRAVFHVTMFALLIGAPLAVVAIVAKPNISGTAVDPKNNLRNGDISNWPAFLALMPTTEDLPVEADKTGVNQSKNDYRRKLQETCKRLSDNINELRRNYHEAPSVIQFKTPWYSSWPALGNIREYMGRQKAVNEDKGLVCQFLNEHVLKSRTFPLTVLDGNLLQPEVELTAADTEYATAAEEPTSATTDGQKPAAPVSPPTTAGMFTRIKTFLKNQEKNQLSNKDLDEDIEDARLSYQGVYNDDDVQAFNLTVLRAVHPECFYTEGKAYRWLVIDGDQTTRLWIFAVAAVAFALCASRINLNATSLHRFYRNRLKHAYLAPQLGERKDLKLSELGTTAHGAPYHLINATIDLARPRFLDQVDAECATADADRRDVQTFIFSQLFCGSKATGWASTQDYEKLREDNIDFPDSIALSGSALDPFRSGSLGLTVAMTAMNLTLGQWLPNPRYAKAPVLPPNFLALWTDWMFKTPAESSYCYVSDGGFTDNLGIMSLLRRRCRLIVAIDASCDSDGAYVDLNWVIRAARLNEGIKILEPFTDSAGPEVVLNTACLDVDNKGHCERHFVLARVQYPDSQQPAWLVYLKPSFTGDEGADLLKYKLEAPDFPNDDTTDQFYDPARVESYRQLGFHIADDFCKKIRTSGANTLLEGVAKLEASVADAQNDATIANQTRRNLPMTAQIALDIGKGIEQIFREDFEHGKENLKQRQAFETSVRGTLQQIEAHLSSLVQSYAPPDGADASRRQKQSYQTGEMCEISQLYKASSECGFEEEVPVRAGERFPGCPRCPTEHSVTWT